MYIEIQSGAVAKSYVYEEGPPNIRGNISPYMRRPLSIHDFATAPL
jgi:hypothetical protein